MYIYILTNKKNGKQYVGQTIETRPLDRITEHFYSSSKQIIGSAIRKYGKENFNIKVISYQGASQQALDAIEQWKIAQLDTLVPNGYNLTAGGRGGKKSFEARENMREAHIQHKVNITEKELAERTHRDRKIKEYIKKGYL